MDLDFTIHVRTMEYKIICLVLIENLSLFANCQGTTSFLSLNTEYTLPKTVLLYTLTNLRVETGDLILDRGVRAGRPAPSRRNNWTICGTRQGAAIVETNRTERIYTYFSGRTKHHDDKSKWQVCQPGC